ncbi:MAG: 50S ribosomal protein L2 [Candidatus Bathyarchaeia archaeon]
MGKRIRAQRRGRGGSVWIASTHKRVAPATYPRTSSTNMVARSGIIEDLVHDPGRGTPLAAIRLEDGQLFYNIAAEGIYVGQRIQMGPNAPLDVGNVLQLRDVPEGTLIYNVERHVNDGGKFARASGAYATLIAHAGEDALIKLTSDKTLYVEGNARATVGVVAAGGRTDKPLMKAGERFHLMRAKGHKYPKVKGVAMIAAVHPHGGGRHKHPGKPKTVARGTPPGRKIGLIAARQTGRSKKRRIPGVSA